MSSFTNNCRSFQNNVLAYFYDSTSSTEQIIVKYSDSDALATKRSLVAKNDGKHYLTNPTNIYIN